MARLQMQDRFLTHLQMGLDYGEELSKIHTALDIGCGPGSWSLELAQRAPHIEQIVGIDISRTMIAYATSQAEAFPQLTFRLMDAQQRLDFANDTFDLVHARLIEGFMHRSTWPLLIADCLRILKPGGILRFTEFEDTHSSSAAMEALNTYYIQALHTSKRTFLSTQDRHISLGPFLWQLLQKAGFTHLQMHGYVIDFSAGSEYHDLYCENASIACELIIPFFVQQQVATKERLQQLLAQFREDSQQADFSGVTFYLGASGRKPQ